MKKETFDLITGRLDEHLKSCGYYLDGIQRTEDLKELTIVNAQLLKKFCREEQSAMDTVMTSELYHLVGMGDLTPVQMSTLIYKVKDWLQYRTVIKVISTNFSSLDSLPTIPVTSTYKLSVLSNITLKSGTGPEVAEESCVKPAAIESMTTMTKAPDGIKIYSFRVTPENYETVCRAAYEVAYENTKVKDRPDFSPESYRDKFNTKQVFYGLAIKDRDAAAQEYTLVGRDGMLTKKGIQQDQVSRITNKLLAAGITPITD